MDYILGPWPWYVGGTLVAFVMFTLILLGKNFGFSSNFRTMCSAFGAGKSSQFFQFDWKAQQWNLYFLLGTVIGGFVASNFLSDNQIPAISATTIYKLREIGIDSSGKAYLPVELFDELNWRNAVLLAIGGLLIGFGTRYAGGCTSGHAISGLSNLQWPSLIAVIGFFIGGLTMVHLLFPLLF